MNILITGASGFIGRRLSIFLSKEHDVYSLARTKSYEVKNFIKMDLLNKDEAIRYFKKFKKKCYIDVIIHLASRLISPLEVEDLSLLYGNLKITESIIEMAKILAPKKVINFSSIAVYPNIDESFSERSEVRTSPNTDCLYGLSKICSENLMDFLLRNKNIVISHLRVSQVYGEGMREDRVIPMFKKELLEKNRITVYGEGKRVSNFISIEKLLKIVKLFVDKNISGIYNIGGENISYLNIAKKLIRKYGNEKSRIIKIRKGSRARFLLDTSKLDAILKKDNYA